MSTLIDAIRAGDYFCTMVCSGSMLITSFFGGFYIASKFIYSNDTPISHPSGIDVKGGLIRLFSLCTFSLSSAFFALFMIGAPNISYLYTISTISGTIIIFLAMLFLKN